MGLQNLVDVLNSKILGFLDRLLSWFYAAHPPFRNSLWIFLLFFKSHSTRKINSKWLVPHSVGRFIGKIYHYQFIYWTGSWGIGSAEICDRSTAVESKDKFHRRSLSGLDTVCTVVYCTVLVVLDSKSCGTSCCGVGETSQLYVLFGGRRIFRWLGLIEFFGSLEQDKMEWCTMIDKWVIWIFRTLGTRRSLLNAEVFRLLNA